MMMACATAYLQYVVKWGCDLQSEHECYITEEAFSGCPVIIRDYLKEIKAFYMQQNDDGKTVAAMDLLVPRVGELIGGSQREERLEYLEDRLDDLKLNKDSFWWYLDLRRYGSGNNEIISLIEDPSGPSQVPNTQTENQPQLIGYSQPENATKVDVEAEHRKKRKKKTSKAWDEFTVVTLKDGTKKVECKHCHSRLALQNSGSTSHLNRHMNSCSIRLASISGSGKPKQQADEDSMQEVSLEIEVLMQ